MTFPEVRRAAAVAHRGRRLLAVEAAESGSKLQSDLAEAVRWARMDEVRFVAALPVDKRHNAKIDYPALQRMLDADS
jgi:hypothetical protein